MDDARDLLAFAAHRDEAAFERLCQRHAGIVLAVCRRALGSEAHAAEDCCQAVFLVLARRAGTIRHAAHLPGWLHQTALWCVRNWLRAQQRRRTHERQAPQPQPAQPVEADGHELLPLLDQALASLSSAQRRAVIAHYWNGQGPSAIAADLGISPDAVRMRVQAGLAALRRWFARHGLPSTSVLVAAALHHGFSAEPAHPLLVATCARESRAATGSASAIADRPARSTWIWVGAGALVAATTLAIAWKLPQPVAAAAESPPPQAAPSVWDMPVSCDLRGATPLEAMHRIVRSQPATEDVRLVWPPRLRWGGPAGGIDLTAAARPLRLVLGDLATATGCAIAWRGNLAILHDPLPATPPTAAITGTNALPLVETAHPLAVAAVLEHLDPIASWRDAGLRQYSWKPASAPAHLDQAAELLFRHPAAAAAPEAARAALTAHLDDPQALHLSAFVDGDPAFHAAQLAAGGRNLDVLWTMLLDGSPQHVAAAARLLPSAQLAWLRLPRTLAQREALGPVVLALPPAQRDQALVAIVADWRRWPRWLTQHLATRTDPPWHHLHADGTGPLDDAAVQILRWQAEPRHAAGLLALLRQRTANPQHATGRLDALLHACDASVVPAIVRELPTTSNAAILLQTLGQSPMPEARAALERQVAYGPIPQRTLAAQQLLLGRQPGAVARVLALADPSRPPADRAVAAGALPAARQLEARLAWHRLCSDPETTVRAAAVTGLDLDRPVPVADTWQRGWIEGLLAAHASQTPEAMRVLIRGFMDDDRVVAALLRWVDTAPAEQLGSLIPHLALATTQLGEQPTAAHFSACLAADPTLSAGARRLAAAIGNGNKPLACLAQALGRGSQGNDSF